MEEEYCEPYLQKWEDDLVVNNQIENGVKNFWGGEHNPICHVLDITLPIMDEEVENSLAGRVEETYDSYTKPKRVGADHDDGKNEDEKDGNLTGPESGLFLNEYEGFIAVESVEMELFDGLVEKLFYCDISRHNSY